MKKRIIAIFFTVLFCMSLVILPSYSEEISNNDTQQYATGRIPTSEEQLAAFKKPENEIGEVKLNAEALAEVKQETSSPSMFSSLQPAEPGREKMCIRDRGLSAQRPESCAAPSSHNNTISFHKKVLRFAFILPLKIAYG